MTSQKKIFSVTLEGTFNAEQQTALTDKLIDAGCDYPEISAHNDTITLEFFPDTSKDSFKKVMLKEIKRVESIGLAIAKMTTNTP